MTKVSDDLKTARARLAVPGAWTQLTPSADKKTYCTMTAPGGACNTHGVLMRAMGVDYYVDAYEWNDAPGRTLDEVLAVYDKAIAIAEKEESEC